MNTCRMCRWAGRAEDREERECLNPGANAGTVRAGAPACERYKISAWALLESVARAEKRMEDMSWRAAHYREMAGRATGSMEAVRVSGSAECSKVARNIDRCIDIGISIDRQAEALKARYELVCELIGGVSSPEGREVLELRHLSRLRWEEIARRMNYDERQLRRIHTRALEEVQKEMDEWEIFE